MLDAPIVHHLRELHKDESITLEKKPSDEYYIDTLSVSSVYGGKGIGSKLIEAAEIHATEKEYEKSHYLLI